MRELYTQQLETMKTRLIQMGAMCEDAISCSVKGMLHGDAELLKKVESTELDINQMEREIERLCMRLLLMQQPVASDLRSVSSALKIISDLERIGDQAYDIAEIAKHLKYSEFAGKVHIQDMAAAAIHMVTDSVEAFVKQDLELAQNVLKEDDTVDQLFNKVRADLIHIIQEKQEDDVEMVLDLLMIAKYLERIGITGMTVTRVLGYGIQKGHGQMYRGAAVASKLVPKVQIDIVVSKIAPAAIINVAKKVLYTGHYGDGKIFVHTMDNVVKIRTGEEGFDALQDKPLPEGK